jgi:hypothetical protein
MSNFLVVVCTKAKTIEEFEDRPIFKSLNEHYTNNKLDFRLFTDNKKGLSECYNEVLKDPKNENKTILFVHDDVELNDLFLKEKLLNSPYTVTGLAGCKTFNKNTEKCAWHLATEQGQMVGEVAHFHPQKGVWTTVFGSTNSRALVLDGLFLAIKVWELKDKDLYFDETFPFHFYDITFCLNANEKRVTCGVLPIHVIHHGLGTSMMSQEWEESNKLFKEKYCV